MERSDEAARADLLARGAVDGVQCYHTTEPLSFFGPGGGLDARGFELVPLCATAPGGLGPRPRRSTASRVAATPRLRRAYSVETSRGDAVATPPRRVVAASLAASRRSPRRPRRTFRTRRAFASVPRVPVLPSAERFRPDPPESRRRAPPPARRRRGTGVHCFHRRPRPRLLASALRHRGRGRRGAGYATSVPRRSRGRVARGGGGPDPRRRAAARALFDVFSLVL